ncbi:MAG: hypothetical protein Q9170_000668 [Blastenia crenularia]
MRTSTRQSAQKRKATTRPRPDHDIPDSSPSRSAAKRKKPNATAPRKRPRAKTPEANPDDDSDFDDSASEVEVEGQTIADKIIPYLDVARLPVNVAAACHNSHSDLGGTQAFAKVSGRNWTYYVKQLEILIGRPPDYASSSLGTGSSPALRYKDAAVQIDLGPSKTISRYHARLFYDGDTVNWQVEVKGRNGLRINDQELSRGVSSIVESGDVLEIAGTQMIFITAEGQVNVHPMFLGQMMRHENDLEAAGMKNDSHTHPETTFMAAPSSSQPRPAGIATSSSQTNGKAAIAPAPPDFVRPTTPVRSPRKPQQSSSAVKDSSAYARAYMIESSEQIDYSADNTRDLKPSIPYAVMITQAILSKESETITLNGIYEWIMNHFAYYRFLKTNWQNSIRHNLSLNAAFSKAPRGPNEPGKGMKWYILPEKREEMIAGVAKHMKRSNARRSSAPSSPSTVRDNYSARTDLVPAPAQPYSSENNPESNGVIKTSPPPGRSPPPTAYPAAHESYTPSRGSRFTALANHDPSHNLPALSDDPSPLPIRRNNIKAGITNSSPVLTSGLYDGPLMTPAPRQHNLNIPLPNTVKLPTSHMPESSPAPFWKFENLYGSTPAKWTESSPLKLGNFQSSSPPPGAANGNVIESPTRIRGLPSNLRMAPAVAAQEVEDEDDGVPIDLTRYVYPGKV